MQIVGKKHRSGAKIAALLAAVLAIATEGPAQGADAPGYKIDINSVCDDSTINKEKLAGTLVNQSGTGSLALRIDAIMKREKKPTTISFPSGSFVVDASTPVWQIMFGVEGLCEESSLAGPLHCSKEERNGISYMVGWVNQILLADHAKGIRRTTNVTKAAQYFAGGDQDNRLVCDRTPPPSTASASPWQFDWKNFRIRGSPDQIAYPHPPSDKAADIYGTSALYDSSDGASVSFKYAGTQKSQTDALIGAIGYDFNFRKGDISNTSIPFLDLAPYTAVDRELTTKPTGKPPTSTTAFSAELVHAGVLGSALVLQPSDLPMEVFGDRLIGHVFVLRPDYLFNLQDDSRLASLNLHYIPYFQRVFNSYAHLAPDLNGLVIVDARAHFGWYTEKGAPAVPTINDNFVRLGGRVGGALEFAGIPGYPIDAYLTYTNFAPLAGYNNSLGEAQGSLTFNFGENKLFGLTVSYRNGRREDNAQRDEAWTVGLTTKY